MIQELVQQKHSSQARNYFSLLIVLTYGRLYCLPATLSIHILFLLALSQEEIFHHWIIIISKNWREFAEDWQNDTLQRLLESFPCI